MHRADDPRPWHRRWRTPLVALAVVLAVVALLAATGQLGKGRPYLGREARELEEVDLGRFSWTLHGATIGNERGYDEVVLSMEVVNHGPKTTDGPTPGALLALVGDTPVMPFRCAAYPGGGRLQPELKAKALCRASLEDSGVTAPKGDLRLDVVMFDEHEDADYANATGWTIGRPRAHVVTVAKDRRA